MQEDATERSFEDLITLAASGQWPLLDLINAAQQLADGGQTEHAISLYRQWLISTPSPMAYMVYFNLGVNLARSKREQEAEQAYIQAIKQKPDFKQAYLNLSSLLNRLGRGDESLGVLYASKIPELIAEANQRIGSASPTQPAPPASPPPNNAHVLLDAVTKTEKLPQQKSAKSNNKNLPLVSILIPTHNRPYYFEIALKSALAQTYPNIQIIISDNSDDEQTKAVVTPYLTDKRIKYYREKGLTATENWTKCIEFASGEYVSWLMDDDILHHEKVERMMKYFLKYPTVGIVTSFRQLIDKDGKFLPPANPTEQLFPKDTMIGGAEFGEFILKNGRNVLGEPTTVLLKLKSIKHGFGWYFDKQFFVLSDVATWLSVLKDSDCVYIADALSYFRQHSGQDQMNSNMKVRATIDWFRLFLLSHRHGAFLKDRTSFHEMLAVKLNALVNYITMNHADLRHEMYNQAEIEQLIADATKELLSA